MKYEVAHTHLQSNKPVDPKNSALGSTFFAFKQGDEVTEAQLTEAGFDVDFLKRNGAIEAIRGSETDEEKATRQRARRDGVPAEPPTTTHEATAGMADAPRGPGKPGKEHEKVEFGDTSSRQLGKEPPDDTARASRETGSHPANRAPAKTEKPEK